LQVRKLVFNLPRETVIQKVREAGRFLGAGKRELGFYLREVKERKLYVQQGCSTFRQFVRLNTDLEPREANELVRVSEAMEELPAINNAFADGHLFWSAVRAMVRVATPKTEEEWVEFARNNTVYEVEKKVASLRRGDRPRDTRFRGSPLRFPHKFNATPELHQAIESLTAVLSKRRGAPVTEEETLLIACQTTMAMEIQADSEDARQGKERKLPSTYRLVIMVCEFCRRFLALLPDGPEIIDSRTAMKLIQGAEVVDLRNAEPGTGEKSPEGVEEGIDQRNKLTHVCQPPPQVIVPPEAVLKGSEERPEGEAGPLDVTDVGAGAGELASPQSVPEPASGAGTGDTPPEADSSRGEKAADVEGEAPEEACELTHVCQQAPQVVLPQGSALGESGDPAPTESPTVPSQVPAPSEPPVPGLPSWAKSAPLIPADPQLRIQHAPNLSTSERPTVPLDERAPRSSPELTRLVLTRAGYFCVIPGCTNLAEFSHHLEWWSQGGPTDLLHMVGVCGPCHDAGIHKGFLLVSGTAGNIVVSRKDGRAVATGATVLPVKLEVEPAPARSRDLPGAEVPALGNRPGGTAPLSIPAEISPAWWLEHRHLFEWSERQKALVLLPDRELPGEAAAFEDPPPAPPAGSSPRERLEGFIGQESAVRNLKGLVAAAKLRGEVPAPALLAGPAGLGKTTLANLAARDLGTRLQVGAGPALADVLALLRLLVSLRKGDVLFIDEIHGLPTPVAECLYQAIDDGVISITVLSGSEARLVKFRLEPFVLIGATTEEAQLPKPLHSRFALRERLDLYATGELAAIAVARGKALGVEVTPEAAESLARGSRGTPRELLAAVSTARDGAQVAAGRAEGVVITREFAEGALRARGIDRFGLSEMDRRILRALHEKGGAIGLRTLADLLGESPRAIQEVHEPFLLRAGWLARTRRGRVLTEKARQVVVFGFDSGRKMA